MEVVYLKIVELSGMQQSQKSNQRQEDKTYKLKLICSGFQQSHRHEMLAYGYLKKSLPSTDHV
jgi:hypothetical protein